MFEEENDIAQIKKYLDKALPREEAIRFEERLEQDPAFHSLFEEMVLMIQGIRTFSRKENLNRLKTLEASMGKKKSRGVMKNISLSKSLRYWAAAAVFALLAITSVVVMQLNVKDVNELYAQNYQPFPNVFAPTVRGEDMPSSLYKKAFFAYDNSNYEEAAVLFKQLLNRNEDSIREKADIIHFYLGNSYLAMDEIPEAKKALLQIDESSSLREQAQWYLALAFLKSNEIKAAETILRELANSSDIYGDKANNILEEIED